jgi:hypothetical protein
MRGGGRGYLEGATPTRFGPIPLHNPFHPSLSIIALIVDIQY